MEYNREELKLIAHTLGVQLPVNKLPTDFYRNYFCASVNHSDFPVLSDLHVRGFMDSWTKFSNLYFSVSDAGIKKFRDEFSNYKNG